MHTSLRATLAGIALGVAALVAFATSTTTFALTPAQRAAVHTVAEIADWHAVDVDPAHETRLGERCLDGTWEASHTYERADGDAPFPYAVCANESTRVGAMARVAVQWKAPHVGLRGGGEGVAVAKATDAAPLGGASRCGHLPCEAAASARSHASRRVGTSARGT